MLDSKKLKEAANEQPATNGEGEMSNDSLANQTEATDQNGSQVILGDISELIPSGVNGSSKEDGQQWMDATSFFQIQDATNLRNDVTDPDNDVTEDEEPFRRHSGEEVVDSGNLTTSGNTSENSLIAPLPSDARKEFKSPGEITRFGYAKDQVVCSTPVVSSKVRKTAVNGSKSGEKFENLNDSFAGGSDGFEGFSSNVISFEDEKLQSCEQDSLEAESFRRNINGVPQNGHREELGADAIKTAHGVIVSVLNKLKLEADKNEMCNGIRDSDEKPTKQNNGRVKETSLAKKDCLLAEDNGNKDISDVNGKCEKVKPNGVHENGDSAEISSENIDSLNNHSSKAEKTHFNETSASSSGCEFSGNEIFECLQSKNCQFKAIDSELQVRKKPAKTDASATSNFSLLKHRNSLLQGQKIRLNITIYRGSHVKIGITPSNLLDYDVIQENSQTRLLEIKGGNCTFSGISQNRSLGVFHCSVEAEMRDDVMSFYDVTTAEKIKLFEVGEIIASDWMFVAICYGDVDIS